MTTGEHELPPRLARYVEAATGDSPRLTITPGYDPDQYLAPEVAQGRTAGAAQLTVPDGAARDLYVALSRHSGAIQADGHVNPADAARWHQAQTELVALIRAENRLSLDHPGAGQAALLPASLADWMENRVAELEQAEASQPEPG